MTSTPSEPLIVTTDTIDGKTCTPIAPNPFILVTCCHSKSVIGDTLANAKNWTVGGELRAYSEMLEKTGKTVLERMAERARAMGADAVRHLECGIRRRRVDWLWHGSASER